MSTKRLRSPIKWFGGKAVLSGYAHPLYAPLEAAGWHRIDWQTACHAAARTRATGILGEGAAMATQGPSTVYGQACDFRTYQTPSGRYPSNLLVTARALGDDSKYADLDAWAREHGISEEWLEAALSAGVLRVSKPSRSEKNAGCEGLESVGARPVAISQWEKQTNGSGRVMGPSAPQRNHHPTTKPTTLFAFLCTLACPVGGVVLDPFGGSGTTAVAAIACGMHWIICEREAEYVAIAEARTAHATGQTRLGGLFAEAEAAS